MARTPLFRRLRDLAQGALRAHPVDRSRRELVAGAAAAALLPLAGGCAPKDARVAVIGAGISGAHVAYRLAQAGVEVALFEASDRVGGRTWTGRGLFPSDQICELGGELVDSNHATMWALAEELGIELDDRLGGPYADLEAERVWVEGAAVPESTLTDQFLEVVGDLAGDFDAAETDDDAFEALDQETLAAYLDRRVPPDRFAALNTFLRVAYRGEFGFEPEEQSALNLIYLIGLETDEFRVFGASDERWHAHPGSDSFATRMVEALPAGTLRLGHALVRAEGRGPYTLTFTTADGELTESWDKLVFALPFSVLRTLDLADLKLSSFKRQIVDELGIGANTKVMLGFGRPVWREDHGASGTVTADLPLQQVWDSSLGQEGTSAILTNFLGGDQALASGQGTPEAWAADVVLADLDAVFPGASAAFTGEVVRMHWPSHPWALGSYVGYKPGQWAFWSFEGEREGDVHFAGDQCSLDWGGWMEGGAEAGARVAVEILEDLRRDIPEAFADLAALQRRLPRPTPEARNPIRLLRAGRLTRAAWCAERRPRWARAVRD